MGDINIYDWGLRCVNTTKSPIHLDPGEFTQTQNLEPDPRGERGAIKTRDGLTALNASALAGTVQGAIQVAIPRVAVRRLYVGRQNSSDVSQGWNTSADSFATASSLITGGVPANPVDATHFAVLIARDAGFAHLYPGRAVGIWNNRFLYFGNDYTNNPATTSPPIRVFDGESQRDFELCRLPPYLPAGVSSIPENL